MADKEKGEKSGQLPTNTENIAIPSAEALPLTSEDEAKTATVSDVKAGDDKDKEGGGEKDKDKEDQTIGLPGSKGESTAEHAPPTLLVEEKDRPSSSSLNPDPSTSSKGDPREHQQTTSAAEDIQRPEQKNKTAHCGACGEMLEDTEEELKNHFCSEAKCEFCDYKFKHYTEFVEHTESVHKDKFTLQCPFCNLTLQTKFESMHPKSHVSPKDKTICVKGHYYKCEDCSGTIIFKIYKDFEIHKIQYHPSTDLKKRQCGLCREIFDSFEILQRHGRVEHDTPSVLICQDCGRDYNTKGALTNHLRTHQNERPINLQLGQLKTHPCPTCSKEFASEVFLKDHREKVHNEKISFPCSECGKTFPYINTVVKHKEEEHKERKQSSPLKQKSPRKGHGSDKDKDDGSKKPRSVVGQLPM